MIGHNIGKSFDDNSIDEIPITLTDSSGVYSDINNPDSSKTSVDTYTTIFTLAGVATDFSLLIGFGISQMNFGGFSSR